MNKEGKEEKIEFFFPWYRFRQLPSQPKVWSSCWRFWFGKGDRQATIKSISAIVDSHG